LYRFITERQNRVYVLIKMYHKCVEKIFTGLKYWNIIKQTFLTLFASWSPFRVL
jgi:hypothetical protein